MPIKLMVVDDSAFMRKIISDSVEGIESVEVVGIARNGLDALEKMDRYKPDIITLDIEMPRLDGIETLKRLKDQYDVKVIMLSSINKTNVTFEALELGAVDFIEKPQDINKNLEEFQKNLEWKLNSLVSPKVKREKRVKVEKTTSCNIKTEAIVIGASTGGPKALVSIIENLPKRIGIPIFIAQHMPSGFTLSFAQRLDKLTDIKVLEAKDGMRIRNNKIYLAPGDFHMRISDGRIQLTREDKIHGVRPAVDYLFETASQKYGQSLLGVILTGMGRDGSIGMGHIKRNNGYTVAQDKETSVVFGMPGTAIADGVVDEVLSLDDISKLINKLLRVK